MVHQLDSNPGKSCLSSISVGWLLVSWGAWTWQDLSRRTQQQLAQAMAAAPEMVWQALWQVNATQWQQRRGCLSAG